MKLVDLVTDFDMSVLLRNNAGIEFDPTDAGFRYDCEDDPNEYTMYGDEIRRVDADGYMFWDCEPAYTIISSR